MFIDCPVGHCVKCFHSSHYLTDSLSEREKQYHPVSQIKTLKLRILSNLFTITEPAVAKRIQPKIFLASKYSLRYPSPHPPFHFSLQEMFLRLMSLKVMTHNGTQYLCAGVVLLMVQREWGGEGCGALRKRWGARGSK